MATESSIALGAALLLAMAIVVQWPVVLRLKGLSHRLAIGMRMAAVVLLATACALAALSWGQWTPFDLRQATLGLALATVAVHLVQTWRLRSRGAGSVTDSVALASSLVAVAIKPGAPPLTYFQRATAFYLQWSLLVLGCGAATVAGGSSLVLAVRAVLAGKSVQLRLPPRADAHDSLRHATVLAWLALGSGLILATWWGWRTTGSLAGGGPHQGWMAVTWLITGIGLLSWDLRKRAVGWAAALAMLATAAAVIGLLQ